MGGGTGSVRHTYVQRMHWWSRGTEWSVTRMQAHACIVHAWVQGRMVREACAGCMHAHARCMHACVLEWYVQRMHGACMHAFVPNFSLATKPSL